MRTLLQLLLLCLILHPAQAHIRFLSISDIHYGHRNTPGDGHDTDTQLFSSAMKKYEQLSKRVDFILTLGDFPTHMLGYWPAKTEEMKTVFHELYVANPQHKPLFYISGNNDPLRGNYQPFSYDGKSVLDLATDWQGACAHCEGLMIDGSHMVEGGYYSSYVLHNNKDILLIALNSTQFAKTPWIMPNYPHQDEDARLQLAWLESQLKKHHAKQLLLAMHIPPGMNYKNKPQWQTEYQQQFIQLLNQYAKRYGQITVLSAHTHMDDIRKIGLNHGKTIYAYATPSISRIHHNNPAMKIFVLGERDKITNYTTYYTTNDSPWENTHYHAINGPDSLFPDCHTKSLASCLNRLSDKTVCDRLSNGYYYGAKSPRVDGSACQWTYNVLNPR